MKPLIILKPRYKQSGGNPPLFLAIFAPIRYNDSNDDPKEELILKKNKLGKILLITFGVLIALYLFLIAPSFNSPDMTNLMSYSYAHRGYYDNENGVPENSLASFRLAAEKGYGVELDVQPSSDGVAMVFHDKDLERLCGVKGAPWDYTAAELQEMKLLGTDETIPTLEEALAVIDGQVPVLVEYKLDKVDTEICVIAQAALDDYEGEYAMLAFHPMALLWYKKNAPDVPCGQLMQDYTTKEDYAGKALYFFLGHMVADVAVRPDFIAFRHDDKQNISVRLCNLMGAPMIGWTIQGEDMISSAPSCFDAVIFNHIPSVE